jgi:predicted nucleotidyltransferase
MRIANVPDMLQSKVNLLMDGLNYVRSYSDDILIVKNSTYEDHMDKLDTILQKLHAANLKINIEKCMFATTSFDYLGFIL